MLNVMGAGGPRRPAGRRARARSAITSATANIFYDELFDLSVDVIPHIHRRPKLSIFFRQRSVSRRACSNGSELLENRRQCFIENFSRSCRFGGKLTPFFLWLHHRFAFLPPACRLACR